MQQMIKATFLSLLLAPFCAHAVKKNEHGVDTVQIDKDRIEYWLTKRGTIKSIDTKSNKQRKVEDYISSFSRNNSRNMKQHKNYQPSRMAVSYAKKNAQKSQASKVQSTKTAVNVLAVLVDFPDLPYNNNRLVSSDTDLFYLHYPPSHFTDLLFSSTGFSGPDGQNFMSVKQFYNQESGESFDFSGSVFGWYRAQNPAAYYGENDGVGGNDKNAESLVVEAINAVVSSSNINLNEFDVKDPHDLDNDGNFNEPDGYIDHLLVVHSSVGEEAGGGYLGTDAIWSHRFSVPQSNAAITGSTIKVRNYTIVPIDAGAGVVSHEFGHDLGLADEYDLNSTIIGSPVGNWSVMSGGSWLGEIRGTQPTVFSPIGREQLQTVFGGNWITQQSIKAKDLADASLDIALTQASVHSSTPNQIKVELPPRKEFFGNPKQKSYQLLAAHQDNSHFRFSTQINVPDTATATLSMWAKWDIEEGFDYAQIKINGVALSNEYTIVSSDNIANAKNIITGKLEETPWKKLSFNLNQYKNTTVSLDIDYVTDPRVGGFGLAIDDITLNSGANEISIVDFEQPVTFTAQNNLRNFSRITAYKDAKSDNYYIQLRSNELLDKGLALENYEPGVLVWYANENFTDNNSSEHPGEGFIAVIDADQNRLKVPSNMNGQTQLVYGDTQQQIRDAAFSLYPQSSVIGDDHLSAHNQFSDSTDYTSPKEPQHGTKLPLWGIKLQVTQQAINNSTATISLSRNIINLTTQIQANREGSKVSFTHQSVSSYALSKFLWDFGDGVTSTFPSPIHTYKSAGTYLVTLKVFDTSGATTNTSKSISVSAPMSIATKHTVNKFDVALSASVEGGVAPFKYLWDLGDGNELTTQTINHRYADAGEFTIKLVIEDAIGQIENAQLKVVIQNDFSIDYSHKATNQVISFSGNVNNAIGDVDIKWDFGDGQVSSQLNPIHAYQSAGNFIVKFSVTDASGTTKELTKTITVLAANLPKAESESSGGSMGIVCLFIAIGIGLRRRLSEH